MRLLLCLLLATLQHSYSLEFKRELVLRTAQESSFKIPKASYFTNSTPATNKHSDLVLKLITYQRTPLHSIWFNGEIIYQAKPGHFLSDPYISDKGYIVFSEFDAGRSYGIYQYSPRTRKITLKVSPGGPHQIMSFDNVMKNNEGRILTRATDVQGNQLYLLITTLGYQIPLLKVSEESKLSYLFPPVMNNFSLVAAKVRYGLPGEVNDERPDAIVLKSERISQVIAEDKDKNPRSLIQKIRNTLDINDLGEIVFITESEKQTDIFVKSSRSVKLYASTKHPDINSIDFFKPVINNNSFIAFRGKDALNRDAVFISNGKEIHKIAFKGQKVESDLGDAIILYGGGHPPFGGSPAINDNNEVYFSTSLRNPRKLEQSYGSAIYKVTITEEK